MTFQPGNSPEIDESFEITTNSGKIIGNYGNNSLSIMHKNSELEYARIVEKIQKESPNSKKISLKNSTESDDKKHNVDYVLSSKKLYDHIMSCDACKKKFTTIWKHMDSS